MVGLGTLFNTLAIIFGGLIGLLIGKRFKASQQETLMKACGISVIFIAIAGAMEGMLSINQEALASGKSMLVVLSIAIGAMIGELIGIENGFEKLGIWLKNRSGNENDNEFVGAFVTASLTVCIGAMAIVGAIQDGMLGNFDLLVIKSVLDFIIIAVMAVSLGKGVIFSAIPVFLLQGTITLLARLIAPIMTPLAISYVSLIGSVLIFCVGINLVWGKQIKVANLLPAIIIAIILAYLPITF